MIHPMPNVSVGLWRGLWFRVVLRKQGRKIGLFCILPMKSVDLLAQYLCVSGADSDLNNRTENDEN